MGTLITFSLFLLLILVETCVATTNIFNQSKGLSIGETLISSNLVFELGFYSPGNTGKRFIAIWYHNINGHKPVWVANRENPLEFSDTKSSLIIGNDGNLRLLNSKKEIVWSTELTLRPNGSFAMLCDEGNFVVKDNHTGKKLWESFSYPGDTFVAGMEIGLLNNSKIGTREEHFLTSWRGDDDPTPGNFVMGITTEKPPQLFIWKSSDPYWRSGPWDGWKFIGLYKTEVGYSNGLTVTQDNQQGTAYITYNAYSDSYETAIVLSPEGVLKLSHWYTDVMKGGQTWENLHFPCEVYGACGPFGVCDRVKLKTCKCLEGFNPKYKEDWKNGNWTGGCVRRTELPCSRENMTTLESSKAKPNGFKKFSAVKIPDKHVYMPKLNASGCRDLCLGNCSCVAYAFVDGIGCMVWNEYLLDLQQFSNNGADLFLQVAHSELGVHKKWIEIVIILTIVLAAILLSAFIYLLYNRFSIRKAAKKYSLKEVKLEKTNGYRKAQSKSSDLPMFYFNTLAIATNNFSETNKLGVGGFGPVYRGKLEDGQEIAVKRLSMHSGQGAVEFKNEILLISKLQHRNLVRLVGYCIEGDEKLIIYEHLKNKSLDTFLFDTRKKSQLDWNKKFNIIEGIARGLLYLHRDSCLRIIHRDLKAGNILLDDNMNPKISDFGTARAFQITQELTNTCRIVGTYGYLSPEYAVGGIFSEKSDVFSFGVLLLEIISGIKVTSFMCEEKSDLLVHVSSMGLLDFCFKTHCIGKAWNLWNEGNSLTLMDKETSISCSEIEITKCLQIGLLCVQDHAKDRPTMPTVVLMLTSDVDVPKPTEPTFYQAFLNSEYRPQHIRVLSRNDLTLTRVEGR